MKDYIYSPFNSLSLFGHKKYFSDIIKLYDLNKFPKTSMLSGKKGLGKLTLILHFLNYVFNKNNYDIKNNSINKNSKLHDHISSGSYENIIYLSGENHLESKISNIRELKSKVLKTTINNGPRFIILDDIELFNVNSLNALLKIIEEPAINNYYILINNETKPLIDTIKSRSLETKFFVSSKESKIIINQLLSFFNVKNYLKFDNYQITPGNFVIFNEIIKSNGIIIEKNYVENIILLIKLYKKTKDKNYINLSLFIIELSFHKLKDTKDIKIIDLYNNKLDVIKDIDNFLSYNLSTNSIINNISNKFYDGQ